MTFTATYEVVTPYGKIPAASMTEAKMVALDSAKVTGKACTVKKVEPYTVVTGWVPEAPAAAAEPKHQTPCVCGTYDLCWGVRVATARTERDLFRAYND